MAVLSRNQELGTSVHRARAGFTRIVPAILARVPDGPGSACSLEIPSIGSRLRAPRGDVGRGGAEHDRSRRHGDVEAGRRQRNLPRALVRPCG